MFVVIELDELKVLAVNSNRTALHNYAHIQYRHLAYQLSGTDNALDEFTLTEMEILIRNLGYKPPMDWKQVVKLLEALPETPIVAWEAEIQAGKIADTDPAIYQYVKGKSVAKCISKTGGAYPKSEPVKKGKILVASVLTKEPSWVTVAPRVAECSSLQNQPTSEAVMAKKESAKPVKEAKAKPAAKAEKPAKAKAEKAPVVKMPEQNGIRAPKADTACGKVWALCDQMSKKLGGPTPVAPVFEKLVAEGANGNNVKAEYARWRKFHGVTGRVVAEKPKAEKPAKAKKAA